ncbi:tRNA (adenine(22)-N(1))-methyltransferase TrmK, partial [Lysinibacillus sp. D4B1_S16]|uniref:tRNA (adenine(22)-N(1))-methyltransferase TrmK n=1 Tax=Lysinibacillus sp. D4B1_S16 TaxID=2941231 RepID=UPI0020C0CD42
LILRGRGAPSRSTISDKIQGKLQGVTRLILQPNIHAKVIREWALAHNWANLDEEILEEDDEIYEILVLQRTQ